MFDMEQMETEIRPEDLVDEIDALASKITREEARLVSMMQDVIATEAHKRNGYSSPTAMLKHSQSLHPGDAHRLVSRANGLLSASYNIHNALQSLGFAEPRLLAWVTEQLPIEKPVRVSVGWHRANLWISLYEKNEIGSVLELEATTCDGVEWAVSYAVSGNPGGAELVMDAVFGFSLPGGGTAVVPVKSTGTITAAEVTFDMEIPYNFEFSLQDGSDQATVGINRQPGGGVAGPEGGQIPFPATMFPEFTFITPILENPSCPDT